MSRARNIKPGFFRNADLVELPVETRLLFVGLWTLADREGRLADRPKQIKMEIYPADAFDVGAMLDELQGAGFIERYVSNEIKYIQIVNFTKHQNPHRDEKASTIPAPCKHGANTVPIWLNPDSRILIPESPTGNSRNEPPAHAEGEPPQRDDSQPGDDSPPDDEAEQAKTRTRAGELCLILRPLGVTATPGHPDLIAWANGLAVSDDEAREAVERARLHKPAPQTIPMAYIAPILATLRSENASPSGGAPPRGGGKQAARDSYLADMNAERKRLGLDGDENDGITAERDITGESARLA